MARKRDLSCLEKRELLNDQGASAEVLHSWGEYYEAAGSLYDAVDFYEKANAGEALARLLGRAREEGNVFLFRRLTRFLGLTSDGDEWAALAARAEELGKSAFAAEAQRLGGLLAIDKDGGD